MSNINYYLKSKLDFYDKSNEEYKHLICIKKEQLEYKEYENNDNMLGHEHYIVFKNTKNKEIYRGTVAKLGLFYKKSKIWVWAWANPTYAVSDTYGARNILLYGLSSNNYYTFIRTQCSFETILPKKLESFASSLKIFQLLL
jgi:hypothetical protein